LANRRWNRSEKGGDTVANPVLIVGKFDGSHLRVYRDFAAGDGIEGVFPSSFVEGMGEIEPADVAAAEPAEIADADTVWDETEALVDDVADGSRTNEKAVVVVVDAWVVFIPSADEFGGVAGEEEILPIKVSEDNLLPAQSKAVEFAVGIFLEKVEVCGVVFETVAGPIAEDAQTGLLVDE